MEHAPAIGHNPSPAVRALCNAWADRNGQPHLGAAIPAAPHVPLVLVVGKGRGRGRARGGRGNWGAAVPALPAHGDVEAPDAGGWRRGTVIAGRAEYATTTAGVRRILRKWNSRTGQWDWKPAGRDYYEHNRQRFIVNVPCLGYIALNIPTHGHNMGDPNDVEDYNRYGPVLLRSTYYGNFQSERIIPLTEEALRPS